MCIHTYSSQYRDAGRAEEIKKIGTAVTSQYRDARRAEEQQWIPRAKEIFPRAILSTRVKGSSALVYGTVGILASSVPPENQNWGKRKKSTSSRFIWSSNTMYTADCYTQCVVQTPWDFLVQRTAGKGDVQIHRSTRHPKTAHSRNVVIKKSVMKLLVT
jgi:hypothetical protein